MIIRDEIILAQPPRVVWEIIADPTYMNLWNHKCVSCTPVAGVENEYQAVFRLNRKERDSLCRVVESIPPSRIKMHFSWQDPQQKIERGVEEEFQLIPAYSGTKVIHLVDFSNSGIPWIFRALMWLIYKFGRKAGPSSLDGIKELAAMAGKTEV